MTTIGFILNGRELWNSRCLLWTENNMEMRMLGDSCPLRDRQTIGLFNIGVSHKGILF